MDSLGDLFPFALAALYLYLKFARRRAPAAAAPPRPARPRAAPRTDAPTPFEQLLARLDEQSGKSPAVPSVARQPEPPVRRTLAATARTAPVRAAPARAASNVGMSARHGFDGVGHEGDAERRGFEHERRPIGPERGFDAENRFREGAPESISDLRAAPPERFETRGPRAAPTPRPAAVAAAPTVAAALREPASLRQAFVLSAVLGRRPPLRTGR